MADNLDSADEPRKANRGGVADFMRRRKISRMLAMQYLFMADMQNCWNELGWTEIGAFRYLAELVCTDEEAGDDSVPQEDLDAAWSFANLLIGGAIPVKEELDELICSAVTNWNINRISYVDRAILRLGAYEILMHPKNVTPATAINEAVELAKKFSDRESHRFVNGVLDKVRHLVEKRAAETEKKSAEEVMPPEGGVVEGDVE